MSERRGEGRWTAFDDTGDSLNEVRHYGGRRKSTFRV